MTMLGLVAFPPLLRKDGAPAVVLIGAAQRQPQVPFGFAQGRPVGFIAFPGPQERGTGAPIAVLIVAARKTTADPSTPLRSAQDDSL